MFRNPTTDLIVVLVIVLLIFGPKRLPTLGRQLGHGLREFKDSITGGDKDSDDEKRPEIPAASDTSAPPEAQPPPERATSPAGAEQSAGGAERPVTPAGAERPAAPAAVERPAAPESAEVGMPDRRS